MPVHRIKAHVRPNGPLVLELPADIPECDVEVIEIVPDTAPRPSRFSADHTIVVQLPANVTADSAEVIVLIDTPESEFVGESLEALLDQWERCDRLRMSPVEVERWIEQERNAWN
jgi:hypothetical protein